MYFCEGRINLNSTALILKGFVFSFTFLRECPNGRKAVFVNKRYKCPEHPSCGEYPNCVVGRKGPGCFQPDVPGCSC